MTSRKKALPLALIAAAVVIPIAQAPGYAGDHSFSSVVDHIKSHYRGRQQSFFGAMMLARFAVRVVRPAGVKNFKVVMLRDLDFTDHPGQEEFHVAARRFISDEWKPLVEYNSRKDHQYTHVYVSHDKDHVRLLVVSLQKTEAYVIQTKFSPEKLIKFIDDPRIMGISLKDKTDGNSPEESAAESKNEKRDDHEPGRELDR